jgi:hypothetical protein
MFCAGHEAGIAARQEGDSRRRFLAARKGGSGVSSRMTTSMSSTASRIKLEGRLQQRYGYAKDQAAKEVNDWYSRQKW